MRTTCRIRHRLGDYLGNWGLGGEGVIITPIERRFRSAGFFLASCRDEVFGKIRFAFFPAMYCV